MTRGLLLVALLPLAGAAVPAKLQPLSEVMQSMLDTAAETYNASFQVAFRSNDGFFELSTGDLATDSLVPLGSVTKPWTCAALLKAAEEGSFSMDDPAYQYIDPVLQAENGTTLLELWNGNAAINTVTTRQLCHHSSGVADYDGLRNEMLQLLHPDKDETPLEYLHLVEKELSCAPGTCSCYSGIGFILAGYVLAGLQKVSSWKDMDQLAFLPRDLRARWEPNVVFAKEGRCSEYERVVHQWLPGTDPKDNSTAVFWDLRNHSCLNGWTMGNLATTAGVLADFHYELFHGGVLNKSSLDEMRTYDVFSEGCWAAGVMSYGLGLEMPKGSVWDSADYAYEGHGGQDYGSKSDVCGYNPKHDFTFCITVNSATGMNCSSSSSLGAGLNTGVASFALYQAAMQWQQNQSAETTQLQAMEAPNPVRPDESRRAPGQRVLQTASPSACTREPADVTIDWKLTRMFECKYNAVLNKFYKASLDGEGAVRVRTYAKGLHFLFWNVCLGKAEIDETIPFNSCMLTPGEPFTSTYQLVRDPKDSNNVVQKMWQAGGITSCEWHPMFDSPLSNLQTPTGEQMLVI